MLLAGLAFAGCRETEEKKLEIYDLGGDFTLTDQNGKSFQLSDLRGKMVLLFFGYTNCPDACPTTLSTIGAVYKKLGDLSEQMATVFISVDTNRDSVAKLKEYLSYYDYGPIGLTGSQSEVTAVTEQFKIIFSKRVDPDSKGGYQVDHSTSVFLVDRLGRVRHHFHYTDAVSTFTGVIRFLAKEKE